MFIVGLSGAILQYIQYDAALDAYRLIFGDSIRVRVELLNNMNTVLYNALSSKKCGDNYFADYVPNNEIRFDVDFWDKCLESHRLGIDYPECSIEVNSAEHTVFVGDVNRYKIRRGYLLCSGRLSANGMVEHQNRVYFANSLAPESVLTMCKVLGVGSCNGEMLGMLYVPIHKGLAVEEENSDGRSVIFAMSGECKSSIGLRSADISQWFKSNRVEALDCVGCG